ncbi:CoA transferase [Specibacter sp. NPDC057265]|uniref:CoA transferase n=1 Tax=Specibacter sp. NPDC057265 TaxID=3346075 RepID=UPI003634CB50
MMLRHGHFQPPPSVVVTGEGALASAYDVSGLAVAVMAQAASAVAALSAHHGGDPGTISVDRQLAGLWFGMSFQPLGWTLPPAWDALAGDYKSANGWIRLHTNAAHHRAAAVQALGVGAGAGRDTVASRVARWDGEELEAAVVAAGGAAACMRTPQQWQNHPQGQAAAAGPLIDWGVPREAGAAQVRGGTAANAVRPLAGVRVLDLTRVIAGPVATRFLALHGAQVLRIDPPHWAEPALAAEMTVGKHCARLDLKSAGGLARLHELLAGADLVVHGYRRGALDKLGLSEAELARRYPALLNIGLNAYGWSGPWSTRRGFDSLVQMSCGIAAAGMAHFHGTTPVPLPVQALDHATGYLCAAAAVTAWRERLGGTARNARLSLARTAAELMRSGPTGPPQPVPSLDPGRWVPERTRWGPGLRLPSAVGISGVCTGTTVTAEGPGSAAATWPAAPPARAFPCPPPHPGNGGP